MCCGLRVIAVRRVLQGLYGPFGSAKAQEFACDPFASYKPHMACFEPLDLSDVKADLAGQVLRLHPCRDAPLLEGVRGEVTKILR